MCEKNDGLGFAGTVAAVTTGILAASAVAEHIIPAVGRVYRKVAGQKSLGNLVDEGIDSVKKSLVIDPD